MLIMPCFRILGVLLMLMSLTMLPPIAVSFWYEDGTAAAFFHSMCLTAGIGFISWLPFRKYRQPLRTRDGFFIVALFWKALSVVGALPFVLNDAPNISFVDAVFESVSGFTTTGSTVLVGLDHLPNAIRYYRQQLQFIGGMGIVILAIAILPMLGVGGLQLFRAESTGPVKDNKLTPRITETAKALWLIYVGLTVACALAYWAGGMSLFDAIGFSFATISTGGSAPYDASFSYYDSELLEVIATVFMVLGGLSFSLHFVALKQKSLRCYWRDSEAKAYFCILIGISALVFAALFAYGTHAHWYDGAIDAVFQVTSIMTTTGFTTATFANWPIFVPILILLAGLIGGCAGSTAGGVKVIRVLLSYKHSAREIKRLIHPNGLFPIKVNQKVVPDRVLDAVWGFLSVFVIIFIIFMLATMATGVDFYTAFSVVAATIANSGPALGEASAHFGTMPETAKWILALSMLVGRLEIFTLLVLLAPEFWRS